jgi:hypothetical protein
MNDLNDYSLFLKFIETNTPNGFDGIDQHDPVLEELERIMEQNNQFIYVADAIQMKIHFTSKGSLRMIGIPPRRSFLLLFYGSHSPFRYSAT